MISDDSVSEMLIVGRTTTVFGVRGWLKVFSYTEDVEALLDYQPWWIGTETGLQQVTADDFKRHGDGLIVHFKDVDDRDVAKSWCQKDILVPKAMLPPLNIGDYYWHQLVGLNVFNQYKGEQSRLGTVTSLLETGANDVLVVKGDGDSVDRSERLIPYSEEFVIEVDMVKKKMTVSWDPEF